MKIKFFIILLGALTTVSLALTGAFSLYLNQERINLVDIQLRESAVALVNSELADIKRINFTKADDLISEELGSSRIGKFFIIRNPTGEIVYKSGSASLLNLNPKESPQIYTLNHNGEYIRILNLSLPKKHDRTLQVGVVLDPTLMEWKYLAQKLWMYFLITIIPILALSYLLTNFLLRPLKWMSNHLEMTNSNLKTLRAAPLFPANLLKYLNNRNRFYLNDEFSILVKAANDLLERININYKMTKPWSYQLAHEIKTPLSILKLDTDELSKNAASDPETLQSMRAQIDRISTTVSQFLEWASVESTHQQDNLFALKIVNKVQDTIDNLNRMYPNRLEIKHSNDFTVIANPHHLNQLINNLLTNALNYSQSDQKVVIEIYERSLTVRDHGPGIPPEVIARIGQPFNNGPISSEIKMNRSGLGLAWINTITKIYNWDLDIKSNSSGSCITIKFNDAQ